MKRPVLWWA